MVAPAIAGIDLFKIAGRSISGWIPSFKTGAASHVRQPFCSCNGLQSKPARTAITAFAGPHSLQPSTPPGQDSLQLRLQSSAWDCNPLHQAHIICN